MEKVVRLTESDLIKIVKRVISEQTYNSKFYNERLDENLDNLKFECITGSTTKNTIILSTENIKFHCLLRWKNHNCIRGTAWQISVK